MMMKKRLDGVFMRLWGFCLILALMPCVSHARGDGVARLVELSGITALVATVPDHFRVGLAEGLSEDRGISGDMKQEILNSVESSVRTGLILDDVTLGIDDALSGEDVAGLLTWYESDTGLEISRAETAASTPEAYEDMLASLESLLSDQERLEMATRINQAISATDLTLELQLSTMEAIYAALTSAIRPGEPLELEAFRAGLASERQAMRQSVEQLVILSMVYTYQDISMEKLESYLAFLETPQGRKFSDAAFQGLTVGLTRAVHRLASDIGAIFSRKMGTTGAT